MDDFRDAARAFIHLVERVERIARTAPDTWDAPALGVWTVRDLIGHTARAISTVETYLDLPAPSIATVPSAEIYYLRVFGGFTDHGAVAERGIAAGRQLGDDAGSSIAASLERALSLIDKQPADRLVAIGDLAIPLHEYLRTRVFELVVHGFDLAEATGQKLVIAPGPVARTAALAAGVAAERGQGREVLFALTGRRALSHNFSIF
jgi:uncharacterized protein (TIGR03083 family)